MATAMEIAMQQMGALIAAAASPQSAIDALSEDIGLASAYGVSPALGTKDATAALNKYFTALKAKGLRYAWFDQQHIYIVNGKLTEARDLILIGSAKIKTTLPDNYFIRITNNYLSQYMGKYNTFADGKSVFTTFHKAILNANHVKVAIMGDSISTAGTDILADCLDITYSTGGTGTIPLSPNGVTEDDSYYYRLIDEMTANFQSTTFDFYNRAIGGTNVFQWHQSVTFNGVTKDWIDHIKDIAPDVLFIAWGMNMPTLVEAKTFKYYMKAMIDYIKANFTKIPTIVVVTSPRPCMAMEDFWGGYEAQLAVDLTAYQSRTFAIDMGYYVMDVNRASNIKRAGTDFSKPYLETLTTSDAESEALMTGDFVIDGHNYKLVTDGQFLSFPLLLKDFTVDFYMKASGFSAGNENLWIDLNMLSGLSTPILIFPFSSISNKGTINVYPDFIDSEHFSTLSFWDDNVNWNDNTFRHIRIEKRGDILNVYVDTDRKVRCRLATNNLPGVIQFKKNSGSTGTLTLAAFRLFEGKYNLTTPTLIDYETWGKHVTDAYDTKPKIGGNGANHPSTIGIDQTYYECIKELVYDLKTINHDFLTDWIAPVLLNDWENFGSGFEEAGYRKNSENRVELKGMIKLGETAQITTIFVFEEGYRPSKLQMLEAGTEGLVGGGSSKECSLFVDEHGNLVIYAEVNAGYINLNGISFYVE